MIQTRRLDPLRRQHHMSNQHREEVRPVPRVFRQRPEHLALTGAIQWLEHPPPTIQTRRLEPTRRQHHMSHQHREEVHPVPRELSQRSEQRANCQTQPIPLLPIAPVSTSNILAGACRPSSPGGHPCRARSPKPYSLCKATLPSKFLFRLLLPCKLRSKPLSLPMDRAPLATGCPSTARFRTNSRRYSLKYSRRGKGLS